jgi:hypothetical protein
MRPRYFFASLTRISDLPGTAFSVEPLPRSGWATGDYVVAQVASQPASGARLELRNGRMVEVVEGDLIVGALGVRRATLEAVGDWRAVGEDLTLEVLTGAGLFGRCTSRSSMLHLPIQTAYRGHVMRGGRRARMRDYVSPVPEAPFEVPVILITGTSMSAGKTTTGRVLVRLLRESGLRVVGAKLTGAGRYRDILSLGDAGAEHILDFVDAGLGSTVVPEDEYRPALRNLLSRVAGLSADLVVAEIGASPLEPYNGSVAIEELGENVRLTVLSASDPYAVSGVIAAFGRRPDLVTGLATSTSAGRELVERLSGVRALNVLDRESLPELRRLLERSGLTPRSVGDAYVR